MTASAAARRTSEPAERSCESARGRDAVVEHVAREVAAQREHRGAERDEQYPRAGFRLRPESTGLTLTSRPMRIGVLTGGGDCPGLNAAIRAIVRKGVDRYGHAVVGFRDGWRGVLENETTELTLESTRGIIHRGGTILGSSRTNPYKDGDDGAPRVRETMQSLHLDGLIAIGGEDTLGVASKLRDGRPERDRPAEDDRQRPRRHRHDVRLRHRGPGRDRRDRPPAHHRRVPPPRADPRGDGPPRRLDRAPLRASPAAPT